jgi:hypothetical protein
MRFVMLGALLLCAGCGDDDDGSTPDAFVPPDLAVEIDGGPLCGCRGDRGTLLYDLDCGEGVCDGPDLLQCVADDELAVGEGRCGDDEDMGTEPDGGV